MTLELRPDVLEMARKAAQLAELWGWSAEDTFVGSSDPEDDDFLLGRLEHFLHEVSHAVDLGIESFGPDTGPQIGEQILLRAGRDPLDINVFDRGEGPEVDAEARTLAIEKACWKLLELPMDGEIYDLANVQDVTDERLDRELADPRNRELAPVVLRMCTETFREHLGE